MTIGTRTAGRPAPPRDDARAADIGRHPADQAGDRHESRTVFALRARGVSWAHIAAQLGRNEIDLRRTYDQSAGMATGAAAPARPVRVAAVNPEPDPPPQPPKPTRAKATGLPLLRILTAIAAGHRTARDIRIAIGMKSNDVATRLVRARRDGFVLSDAKTPMRWSLTRAGRDKIKGPAL